MLKSCSIVILLMLLLVGQTAKAQSPATISCTTRLAKYALEAKLFLNCPAAGRTGYVSDVLGTDISTADVTLMGFDGQIRELKLTPKQTALIFGESTETGMTASIDSLTDKLSRRTANGEMTLYPGEIASLGFDPNTVGSQKLSVRSVNVSNKTVLTDAEGKISTSPGAKTTNAKCLYVGSMKMILPKSANSFCAPATSLCTAAVECMDERVGWVTRAAVCKSVDKRCPTSADDCASDQSGADFSAVTIENSAQPKTRETGTKR